MKIILRINKMTTKHKMSFIEKKGETNKAQRRGKTLNIQEIVFERKTKDIGTIPKSTQSRGRQEELPLDLMDRLPRKPVATKDMLKNMRILQYSRNQRQARTVTEYHGQAVKTPLNLSILPSGKPPAAPTLQLESLEHPLPVKRRSTSIRLSEGEVELSPSRDNHSFVGESKENQLRLSSIRRSFLKDVSSRRKMLLSETFVVSPKATIDSSILTIGKKRTQSRNLNQKYTTSEKIAIYNDKPNLSVRPNAKNFPKNSVGNSSLQRIADLEHYVELLQKKICELEQRDDPSRYSVAGAKIRNEQFKGMANELEEMYENYSSLAKDCIELKKKHDRMQADYLALYQTKQKALVDAELENSNLRMKIKLLKEALTKRNQEFQEIEVKGRPKPALAERSAKPSETHSGHPEEANSLQRSSSLARCIEDSVNSIRQQDFMSKVDVELIFPKQLKSYYASAEL